MIVFTKNLIESLAILSNLIEYLYKIFPVDKKYFLAKLNSFAFLSLSKTPYNAALKSCGI